MVTPYPMTPEDIKHAEAVFLGSLLLHQAKGTPIQAGLQPEDFSEERHRLIYEALQTVLGTSEMDMIHAVRILLSDHELERIGGEVYLMTLKQQAESTTIPIDDQAYLLKQASLHRLLRQVGEALHTRKVHYDANDLLQVIGDLEHAMHVAQQLLSPKDAFSQRMIPLQTDLEGYLTDLDTRMKQNTTLTGLPTGFADLDTITGGLQRSDLIIIAGPPSSGKTSFALSIALHVLLKEHRSIGLFSLEAPKKQVIERLFSMEAHLEQRLLRSLELDEDDRARLGAASASLSEANLWIDDTANLSTTLLHEQAHFLVERCGVELLIVDYVHLMLSSINDKRHENRVQEIGEISRSLKALARELAIPVLALAQLSRAFESRPLKKFQLSDLRDGSLENDADLVLFLSLVEAETIGTTAVPRLATISIAKHRNGPRADLDVCFQPGSTRFHDLPTLLRVSTQERQTSSFSTPTDQPHKQFPRLMDILEQTIQRQPRRENPKAEPLSSSHRRELPHGYVLDDEEINSENEPDTTTASFVNEQEQNLG
jgi:replicative DNA helicase